MTDKPESETTAGLSVGEVLPVFERCPCGTIGRWVSPDLQPNAVLDVIAAQAAEIERLKEEKAELSYEFGAAMQRCSLTIERLTRERDAAWGEAVEIREAWNKAEDEFAALKAKQVADIPAGGLAEEARDGWKLVPMRPTQAMLEAALRTISNRKYHGTKGHTLGQMLSEEWIAMVHAASTPQGQEKTR